MDTDEDSEVDVTMEENEAREDQGEKTKSEKAHWSQSFHSSRPMNRKKLSLVSVIEYTILPVVKTSIPSPCSPEFWEIPKCRQMSYYQGHDGHMDA